MSRPWSVLLGDLGNFLECYFSKIVKLFEQCFEISQATPKFCSLFCNIITCCNLNVFNYAESLITSIFLALKKNPYKYSELLTVFDKLASLNKDNLFMRDYMKMNLAGFCSLFCSYLDGKWQDSEFLGHFLKLLSTIYTASKVDLLAQPSFVMISDKLLNIFVEYNSYEARRDIIKFW